MNVSKLNYHGKVTIKVKNKPPVRRHNEGTQHLFNLFNNILVMNLSDKTGTMILNDSLPAYFQIIHDDNGSVTSNRLLSSSYNDVKKFSLLISDLQIQNRNIEDKTNAKFTALLTHSILNQSTQPQGKGYVLLLDSSDNGSNKQILAFSKIDLNTIEAIYNDVTGQAAVDWVMSFDNSDEESN